MPVGWPATAQWGGDGVVVDAGAEVDMRKATGAKVHAQTEGTSAPEAASDVVRINPATGEITAENPGTAVVEVTVNGKTAKATVEVAGDEPPPGPGDDRGDEDAGADDDGASAGSDDGTSAASDDNDDDADGGDSSNGSDSANGSDSSDGGDGADGGDGSGSADGSDSEVSAGGSDDSNSSDDGSDQSGNRDGSANDGSSASGGADPGSNSDGSGDGGGDLPRTGGPVLVTAAVGALLVIGGLVIARLARARLGGRSGVRH